MFAGVLKTEDAIPREGKFRGTRTPPRTQGKSRSGGLCGWFPLSELLIFSRMEPGWACCLCKENIVLFLLNPERKTRPERVTVVGNPNAICFSLRIRFYEIGCCIHKIVMILMLVASECFRPNKNKIANGAIFVKKKKLMYWYTLRITNRR